MSDVDVIKGMMRRSEPLFLPIERLAQAYLEANWPDAWFDADLEYIDWDKTLAQFTQELQDAIHDRWIAFRDETSSHEPYGPAAATTKHSPNNPCRCSGRSWKPPDPNCTWAKAGAPA